MGRDDFNSTALGPALNAAVKQARVLMVGAGGIGCELLKNLAQTGFGHVEIVDLDTIDLSNLNRQFLFRHEHIKKSKALVAKEAAERFNPDVRIVAHHANIKEPRFNIRHFGSFNLVFNALDNLDARRHVNRMCLAADVPLIDAGTTGFNGQVQVIKKGVTPCYDCVEREVPRTFPVCTIRSTPSQPIHCIVWGKSYLLNEMFGTSEDAGDAFDHSQDAENRDEIEELKREAAALRSIRRSVGTPEFPRLLFDKVFKSDIERLRSMKDMWKTRTPPEPLDFDTVLCDAAGAMAERDAILRDDQKAWTLEESFVVFCDSLKRLSERMLQMKAARGRDAHEPTIEFDKDDDDTLDFVAASANIRSTLFGIDRKSRFDIKQMAGNIIPAIATTNAITAGLCVLEAFRVLRGEYDKVKDVYIQPFHAQRLLAASQATKPNPKCPVCSVFQTTIYVDLERATLHDLVEQFVRFDLGFGDREFVVNNESIILYDVDETQNLPNKLRDLGISQDTSLTIVDEDDDDPYVNVRVNIQEASGPLLDKPIKANITSKLEIPRKPKDKPVAETNGVAVNGNHAPALEDAAASRGVKRLRDDDLGLKASKKAKVVVDEVIVVDDDPAGGQIIIDDD